MCGTERSVHLPAKNSVTVHQTRNWEGAGEIRLVVGRDVLAGELASTRRARASEIVVGKAEATENFTALSLEPLEM